MGWQQQQGKQQSSRAAGQQDISLASILETCSTHVMQPDSANNCAHVLQAKSNELVGKVTNWAAASLVRLN
jgi:hypothetical protein